VPECLCPCRLLLAAAIHAVHYELLAFPDVGRAPVRVPYDMYALVTPPHHSSRPAAAHTDTETPLLPA